MKNILVAEDDRSLRDGLVQSMSRSGYKVQVAQSGKDALEKIEKQVFDLVIAGQRMGGSDALEILRKARSTNAGTLVIVTGENGSGAVEAMKSGAFDYLQKPLSLETIEMKVQRAMEHQRMVVRMASMTEPLADPSDRYGLIGNSSLPDNLLQTELFGHEKGAFTGADQMRIGRFEMANDGTLFLDEVGNMSANTQAKVLRAIQNQEFERLGGSRTIKVDVRIVAATNINLETAIKEGRFREDLYYRLNVVTVGVPALRERVEDIQPLAEYFLKRFARELRRRVTGFSADAARRLQEHRWPGNVRELENTIERAVLMCEGDTIRPADLTLLDREHTIGMTPALAVDLLNLEALEKSALLEALKRSNWIQKEAAKILGISSRVMNYKVHKHGITHDRWSKNRN